MTGRVGAPSADRRRMPLAQGTAGQVVPLSRSLQGGPVDAVTRPLPHSRRHLPLRGQPHYYLTAKLGQREQLHARGDGMALQKVCHYLRRRWVVLGGFP
jgi:hypothetical protein